MVGRIYKMGLQICSILILKTYKNGELSLPWLCYLKKGDDPGGSDLITPHYKQSTFSHLLQKRKWERLEAGEVVTAALLAWPGPREKECRKP